MIDVINNTLNQFVSSTLLYIPRFFTGLIILIIGILLAGILKHGLLTIVNFFKIDQMLSKAKVLAKNQLNMWLEVLLETLRWMLIVVFLVPALEVWGLNQAINLLYRFLDYLPNVIIAVIIGFIGVIASNLVADLVKHSIKTMTAKSANSLAMFAKGVIVFFTILIVLNQLGVAQNLVNTLFTGIVAMIAIAGGLAFGLGGQQVAKEILESLKRKLEG